MRLVSWGDIAGRYARAMSTALAIAARARDICPLVWLPRESGTEQPQRRGSIAPLHLPPARFHQDCGHRTHRRVAARMAWEPSAPPFRVARPLCRWRRDVEYWSGDRGICLNSHSSRVVVMRKRRHHVGLAVVALVAAALVLAHGDGLDSEGGHTDRRQAAECMGNDLYRLRRSAGRCGRFSQGAGAHGRALPQRVADHLPPPSIGDSKTETGNARELAALYREHFAWTPDLGWYWRPVGSHRTQGGAEIAARLVIRDALVAKSSSRFVNSMMAALGDMLYVDWREWDSDSDVVGLRTQWCYGCLPRVDRGRGLSPPAHCDCAA